MEENKDEIMTNDKPYYYEAIKTEESNKQKEGINPILFKLNAGGYIPYLYIAFIALFGYQAGWFGSTETVYGFKAVMWFILNFLADTASHPILSGVSIIIVVQMVSTIILLSSKKIDEIQKKFIIRELVVIGGSILGACMFHLMIQAPFVFVLIIIIVVPIFGVGYVIGKKI